MPLLLGLAIAIVPLQVGARSLAFPRAAALSFWVWLVGVGLMLASYATDGGPTGDSAEAVELFLASLFVMAAALVLASACVATTVLTLRAPGMTMPRVPLFSWASLVSAVSLLLSLPVLAGLVILLYVDHRYGQIVFGGTKALNNHLDWAITPPQVTLYALAGLGIVADVLPAAARTRGHLRGGLFGAIGLAGIVGIGAFYQPVFWPDVRAEAVFAVANVLVVIAPLAVLAATASTFMGGRTRLLSPLVWGISAVLVYVLAAALGVLLLFTDLELQGTVFPLGQLNATLVAGLLAGLGGFVYWGPKLWGRMFPEGVAKGFAALGLLGAVALVLPDVVNGWVNDQPAGEVNFPADGLQKGLNAVGAIGSTLLVLVIIGVLVVALRAFRKGDAAGDDPWDGNTLEWATTSPPPPGNFAETPLVRSDEPLRDHKPAAHEGKEA
jgi:heme/copper-type cytochrome/quinol oxidase subunit 1